MFLKKSKDITKKIFSKIKNSTAFISSYKSWPIVFLYYFNLLKDKNRIFKLRDKTTYLTRNRGDIDIINEIYISKEYNKSINKIKDNSIVIDIGAHIGIFSVLAAKLARNVRVYSYEPFNGSFQILIKNIELNRLQENIHPFMIGIGNKKSTRMLFLDKNPAKHTMFDRKKNNFIPIKIISLKDIFTENRLSKCDLLKLDCEGAEYEIIFNTSPKFLQKIKNIIIECHPNGDVNKLKKFLEKNNFKTEIEVKLSKRDFPFLFAENIKD